MKLRTVSMSARSSSAIVAGVPDPMKGTAMQNPEELRRRAAYLFRQSEQTCDSVLAARLQERAYRHMTEAANIDGERARAGLA